jgi:hypothetical protein
VLYSLNAYKSTDEYVYCLVVSYFTPHQPYVSRMLTYTVLSEKKRSENRMWAVIYILIKARGTFTVSYVVVSIQK